MSDEHSTQPDPAAQIAQLERDLAESRARASAFEQGLSALQRQPAPVAAGNSPIPGLPPQAYQYLQQRGFTDEAIAQNWQIMVPFLEVLAQPVIATIQQQQHTIDFMRAPKNPQFKHWNALESKIEALREEASRNGRWMTPQEAYGIAIANHPELVTQAREQQAQSAATVADVTATNGMQSPRTIAQPEAPTPITSARDILALPAEERSKLWDDLADRPIQ